MTGVSRQHRWNVLSLDRLRDLAAAPLPGGIAATPARRSLHRDIYLDTADGILSARRALCRLQVTTDDHHTLSLELHEPDGTCTSTSAKTRAADPLEAIQERNTVTRRVRGIVDPASLLPRVAVEVERWTRFAARDWLGRARAELHYDAVTVRRDGAARRFQQLTLHGRPGAEEAVDALARALSQELALRSTESVLDRAELLLKWMPVASNDRRPESAGFSTGSSEIRISDSEFLHPELSFLESQARVLTLAAAHEVPIAERLRFLGIVAANLDEFFMVRVAGLKMAAPELAEESAASWGDVVGQLHAIAAAARALQSRQYEVARDCFAGASAHGTRLRLWNELTAGQQAGLRDRYLEEIHPELTPLAMTMSPGHPFPRVPHLSLSIAAVLRDPGGGVSHFAQVEIPENLPRLMRATPGTDGPGGSDDHVPVEEVVRANLPALYPGMEVEHAFFFRLTRSSLLAVDESSASLLEAVDEATRRGAAEAVVRVEVDREMPPLLRELVLDALRREQGAVGTPLDWDDVYEVDGPLDLRSISAFELPATEGLRYAPLAPRNPLPHSASLLDCVRTRDLLVHHPFDSFADTVVRFFREAAEDPQVTVIKATLYRVGEQSPIIEALRTAARSGKQVYAFVELRARFDEATNVKWVRALEKAGVHVVYGLRGLKTHAKASLVVRREGTRLQRYVHVGTGNYNARTGLAYTDLSLFSADERLASDLTDLFNSLTGSSAPLSRVSRGMLVAPGQMLTGLLECIEGEAAIARAGRAAAIRIKVNGLSEPEVARALHRAASDGVAVDLVVRGICTLRPPPPGSLQKLRVVATTGRFLEHSRIYHFGNDGDPLYYIGSADLRPRNLRRRVELLAPVHDGECQAILGGLLDAYLNDTTAWELAWNGEYTQRRIPGLGTQERLLEALALSNAAKPKSQDTSEALAR